MSQALKGIAVVTTIAAVGAGGYAWTEKNRAAQAHAEADRAQATCKAEVAACNADLTKRTGESASLNATVSASQAELEGLRGEKAEAAKQLAAVKALTEKFQKMVDSGKLTIVMLHGRMVVKLPASVFFASGNAELTKDGKDVLKEVASVLRGVPNRQFMIAGHTDNVPVDPKANPQFKNNLELSTSRALVVAEQLIASGMNKARLIAAGYAENEPVANNGSEAGRQENRRIEIVLMPDLTQLPATTPDGGAPDAGAHDAGLAAKADAGK